jgi:tRNA/tmRNA/rRNA uracil-C5-methylase (TrmA/RlmC/RlmD family)
MATPPAKFNPHPFAYHQELTVDIEDITNMGEGVGRVEGWVVMVPFVEVGERVRVRVWRNHASYSQADLLEVLQPAPGRVAAACPRYGICGGCQYQHISYPRQLELKQGQLREIYRRIAGISVEPQPTIPSPKLYGYRTKITPHYRPRRPGQQEWPIGFLAAGRPQLVDIPDCPIASDAINAALPSIRAQALAKADNVKREGTLLLRESIEGVLSDFRQMATEEVAGVKYRFVAGEFFQVNRSILPLLVAEVMGELKGEFLVDAYCGVGFFALQAAARCQRVLGVELSASAIALAKENATLNGVGNVEFVAASAEKIFAQVSFPADRTTVIMDPPRAGASEDFLRQLIALRPARVIYVACDPATQARDVKILLEAGFRLERLRAADLFPQTRHIEAIAVLS